MKLHLPPRVSNSQFEKAITKLETVVGKDWVMVSDQDRDAYSDIYAPGSEEEWPAAGAVAPANVDEIQAIVRIANEYKMPIWPVSRGKNLGYGAAAPRMAGTLVMDLGRMKKILELDPDLAYCVVEPGVSFFDLYEEIQRKKHPLWMSVPGNAWGSVMGNALEHGVGYTPYGVHASHICGIEAVLPQGDLMRTGMGAMKNNQSWNLFPFSYGPSFDLMFSQSNMGVVTKMGMSLMPAPESSLQMVMEVPDLEDISWVMDTLAPLKISGVIDQSIFVPSWLGKMVLKGQRGDFWDKPSAMPDWRVAELLKEHKIGYWQVAIRLYGNPEVIKARANIIKAAFKQHIATPFQENWWHEGETRNMMDATMGIPTAVPLQMGDWVGGRGAHMGFSPVVPATSRHVMDQLNRSKAIIAAHDVDFYASFTLGGRFANNVNMLMYDRDNEEQMLNIRKLFNALIKDARENGYGEYRTHLGWMDPIADTFDFNDHAYRRMTETIKDSLDPNGILAPGKQGIWPKAYRDQADR